MRECQRVSRQMRKPRGKHGENQANSAGYCVCVDDPSQPAGLWCSRGT